MSYVQELTERNEEDSFGRGRKTRVTTVIFFYRGRFDEFSAIQGMHHTLAVTRCIYPGWARADSGFWYGGDTVQTEVKTEARDRDPNVLQLPEPTSESAQLSRPRVCLPPLYEAE